MKQEFKNNIEVVVNTSVKENWQIAQHLYNEVPADLTFCESHYDAKMYTTVLLLGMCIAFPPLIFLAWYLYHSAEKEISCSVSEHEKSHDENKPLLIKDQQLN